MDEESDGQLANACYLRPSKRRVRSGALQRGSTLLIENRGFGSFSLVKRVSSDPMLPVTVSDTLRMLVENEKEHIEGKSRKRLNTRRVSDMLRRPWRPG